MATRYGTSHFVSLTHAAHYYQSQGYGDWSESYSAAAEKLRDGEIAVGKPTLQRGERLLVIDNGTRYAIEHGGQQE
jgi:hypothetical protein